MKLTGTIIFVYGIIMTLGGIFILARAGGLPSVSSAIVCGAALIALSKMINKKKFSGVYLSLIVSIFLATFFGLKFSKFNHILPDGILTIVSMFGIGFSVWSLSNREQLTKP